jgi:hypothetical protein
MTDTYAAGPAGEPHGHDARSEAHPVEPEEFDHELNIRWILWTTVGLVAMTLLAIVATWGGLKGMDAFERHHAEAPPAMMAADRQTAPPGPQLQASPSADMSAMRVDDARLMDHAAWVDRAQGTVRLPIALAIDILAERGLPKVTTPPLSAMMAHGSYADDGRPPADQPSPGTLLPPPGMGIGSIGPPSAGAGQQFGAAMPGPPVPMAGGAGAPAAAAQPPRAGKAAAPGAAKMAPIVAPPPPGGRP